MAALHFPTLRRRAALISLTVIVAAAAAMHAMISVSRDAAFYIHVGSQTLRGLAPHYADIDQVLGGFLLSNFALFLPPSALVAALGVPFEWPLRLYIAALAVWPLLHLWRFCRDEQDRRPLIWVLLPVYAAMVLVFPIDSLGQREQVFTLLILPYLLATIQELEETQGRPVPRGLGIGVGALAALLIKPHFVAVFVAVEAVRLLVTRRPRLLLDPVNLIIGAGHALYYGYVLIQFRQSPADPELIAWVLALKRAYLHKSLAELLLRKYSLFWLVAAGAALLGLIRPPARRGTLVWLAAFGGGMASAIVQSLGVDYHWLIATTMTAMLAAWAVAVCTGGLRLWAVGLMAVFVGLAGTRLAGAFASERVTARHMDLLGAVMAKAAPPSRTLLMIDGDYGPLYPLLGRTGYASVSSYHVYWFLDSLAASPELLGQAQPRWLDDIAATTARDILEKRPGLVFVPTEIRPAQALVLDDERVKAALAGYRPAGAEVSFTLLRRQD